MACGKRAGCGAFWGGLIWKNFLWKGGLRGGARICSLDGHIGELDQAASRTAEEHPQARLLMTQPGVGPITALAFVLTIGEASRFAHSKQVASYLGLIPSEHSSGGRQRLGAISKQGNRFLRMLWRRRRVWSVRMQDFASSTRPAAITSRKAWPRWRQESWPGDSTG